MGKRNQPLKAHTAHLLFYRVLTLCATERAVSPNAFPSVGQASVWPSNQTKSPLQNAKCLCILAGVVGTKFDQLLDKWSRKSWARDVGTTETAVTTWVFGEVLLVIVFGVIKLWRCQNFRGDFLEAR
jgi:hypothetical protein